MKFVASPEPHDFSRGRSQFGGVAYEEIGIAVINDIATAKIVIGEDIVEKEVVKEEILGDFEW
jgi:hypothetical protein